MVGRAESWHALSSLGLFWREDISVAKLRHANADRASAASRSRHNAIHPSIHSAATSSGIVPALASCSALANAFRTHFAKDRIEALSTVAKGLGVVRSPSAMTP
jgi:hypothetical protein